MHITAACTSRRHQVDERRQVIAYKEVPRGATAHGKAMIHERSTTGGSLRAEIKQCNSWRGLLELSKRTLSPQQLCSEVMKLDLGL